MGERRDGPELPRSLMRKLERYRDFPLESLEAVSQIRDVLAEIEVRAIVEARERGATWDDIAEALSISRQSVLYRLRTLAELPRRGASGGSEPARTGSGADPPLSFRVEERHGEHVLLGLSGELTGHGWTDKLRRFLEERYVDDGVRRIRLDLAEVTELDEEGLAALKAVQREAAERHKELLLEGTTGQVRTLLVAEGLDASG
ncbi:MAG: STAS domain-containing protein [Actinomycetota bacterium]|nr:STAS domain-containing protein [Actinomycetota bacterium]